MTFETLHELFQYSIPRKCNNSKLCILSRLLRPDYWTYQRRCIGDEMWPRMPHISHTSSSSCDGMRRGRAGTPHT